MLFRSWDAQTKTYALELSQECAPTPGQPRKQPLVIPVALGLVGANGADMDLSSTDASAEELRRGVFELAAPSRRIVFRNVAARPVPSLLRGFSAPARLDVDLSDDDLLTLLACDSDMFNRWQAAQSYATKLIIRSVEADRKSTRLNSSHT